jgi:hypothetical protein
MKINIKRPKNLGDKKVLDSIIDGFKEMITTHELNKYVSYKSDSSDKCKTECKWVKESSDNNSGSYYCEKCLTVRYE